MAKPTEVVTLILLLFLSFLSSLYTTPEDSKNSIWTSLSSLSKSLESHSEDPFVIHGASQYRLLLVADPDHSSKRTNHWETTMMFASLSMDGNSGNFSIHFDDKLIPVRSKTSTKSRGMELSELVLWRGDIYTVCDITGLV
eukprot:TRINITY_DN1759_c0_g2_i3.p1 TRINITY_DN1759_c0_g2~~TRINITY_DN1759_c0_g2_i3.p1  ORF type:complete len:141 (+),score=18.22 TRINITY_DN1759_c0_g2_i3:548-970(+)